MSNQFNNYEQQRQGCDLSMAHRSESKEEPNAESDQSATIERPPHDEPVHGGTPEQFKTKHCFSVCAERSAPLVLEPNTGGPPEQNGKKTMRNSICLIDITKLDFAPIPREPIDPIDLFAFACIDMRRPDLEPMAVRFDVKCGKYLVVSRDPGIYGREGIQLEAARKLGLSQVKCRVVDDPGPDNPVEASPAPVAPTPSPATVFAEATTLPAGDLNQVLGEVLPAVGYMSMWVRGRMKGEVDERVSDNKDWQQEAVIALWREAKRPNVRFKNLNEVSRFIFGVLRRQAARSRMLAQRVCAPLLSMSELDELVGERDDERRESVSNGRFIPSTGTRSILDDLITEEDSSEFARLVDDAQVLVTQTKHALAAALERMSAVEATAAGAWLDGASYKAAGNLAGITQAQVRRIIDHLKKGDLAERLKRVRDELKEVDRVDRLEAASISLGRLARLLMGPANASGWVLKPASAKLSAA
ncbi:MAG TPA: hypothetical protein VFE62_10320 [Gemmataceae bacterium]|nr:hypothetical protein [Gemmataceae bacterium]